jgi:hypothetical protein
MLLEQSWIWESAAPRFCQVLHDQILQLTAHQRA